VDEDVRRIAVEFDQATHDVPDEPSPAPPAPPADDVHAYAAGGHRIIIGRLARSDPSLREELAAFGRYAVRLPSFLRNKIDPAEARRRVIEWHGRREESFLDLVSRAVYANPGSPYRALLQSAGIEAGDVRRLVGEDGLKGALEQLRDAGVYATLDEFKGRQALERDGVSRALGDGDFDNPLISGHYWGATGGSRGTSRRVMVDLTRLGHETAYHALFREAFGLADRPFAIWRVIPPSRSGLNNYLYQVKAGGSVQQWFNPYQPPRGLDRLRFGLMTAYTLQVGRRYGGVLRRPVHCASGDATRVARWLAERTREGRPAVLDAQLGLGIRACLAALREGLDISGTFFRFGGEPFTEAKAELVARTGSRAVCHYSMAEIGRVGCACAEPAERDDMHFMSDKLELIQRPRTIGATSIDVLSYTTLLPSTPKVMINVESDDYGEVRERDCGCPLGRLGLTRHLQRIHSWEKLTTDGNHFLGSDLHPLLDEVLPARFGGAPTNYQLVEEEVGGVTKLSLVVAPEIGPVAESEVLSTVYRFLREEPRNRVMADFWAQSETLRVVRREPHMTITGKILPLHVARPS
jgi:hypothetical protein